MPIPMPDRTPPADAPPADAANAAGAASPTAAATPASARETVVPVSTDGDRPDRTAGKTGSKPRRLGPFRMGRRLGVGGMGVVYAAVLETPGRPDRAAAVKVLNASLAGDPKVAKRFEREMDILKKLRHPHVVRYFGGGRSAGKLFYAMEWMKGGSVEDRLKEAGPVDWRRAADLAAQTADALHYAHQRGVIHRDLKPANLFFDTSGTLKLGDFGIARDANATALTAAGRTVGTYAYMAPEQISAAREVGPKTDLYALGCVLHELLTGDPPFAADNPAKLLHAHLSEPAPRVRSADCPRWLSDLIASMLAKDPGDRPFDALAVSHLLTEEAEKEATRSVIGRTAAGDVAADAAATVADARTLRDEARTLLGRKKRKPKRRAVPLWERWYVLAGLLVALGAGVAWAVWPPGEEELYRGAAALMASDDVNDWRAAREQFIVPLLARFPETDHAREVAAWEDRIDVDLLERQITLQRASAFTKPRNELERQYHRMEELADFGDLWGAAEVVATLRTLLEDNAWTQREEIGPEAARHYDLLLAHRADELEAELAGDALGRQAFVSESLRAAERAFADGNAAAAREKWQGVVDLYDAIPELAPQVAWARARLRGEDPRPIPGFITDPPDAPAAALPAS